MAAVEVYAARQQVYRGRGGRIVVGIDAGGALAFAAVVIEIELDAEAARDKGPASDVRCLLKCSPEQVGGSENATQVPNTR